MEWSTKPFLYCFASGSDPKTQNDGKETALIAAVRNDKAAIVEISLTSRAMPLVQDNFGKAACSWAVLHDHVDVAHTLLHSLVVLFSHDFEVRHQILGNEVADTIVPKGEKDLRIEEGERKRERERARRSREQHENDMPWRTALTNA